MRLILFIVAAASLSIIVFARSAIRVTDHQQREDIKFTGRNVIRAQRPEEPSDTNGQSHDEPSGTNGQSHDDGGAISPAKGGNPNSPPSQTYAPASEPNGCLQDGSECPEIIKNALEVATKLADLGKSTLSSSAFATVITSAPLPNYDVITAISMYKYLPLLNTDEQEMWSTAPLCFFANIEGYYAAAASSALNRRDQIIDNIECEENPAGGTCPQPTLPPPAASSIQSDFFETYMPSVLVSAYGAPRNDALSTATTTCSGLHSAASITATYMKNTVTTSLTGGRKLCQLVQWVLL